VEVAAGGWNRGVARATPVVRMAARRSAATMVAKGKRMLQGLYGLGVKGTKRERGSFWGAEREYVNSFGLKT
jgi:hypothetical protein